MQLDQYEYNFKNILESFKYFPRIFKMLWSVHKVYLILIIVLYIISGIIPAMSIIATQTLINTIQTGNNREFFYVLIPLIIYIVINFTSYIVSQLATYFQSVFKIDLNYKLSVSILEKAKTLSLIDFENADIYDKLRRAQSEVKEKPYVVFSLMIGLLSQIVALVSSTVILASWNRWIVIPVVIIPIISTMYMTKLGYLQYKIEWERSSSKRKSWYINYIMTNDIAFKEIKLYNLGHHFINGYKELYSKFIVQDKQIIQKRTKLNFIFEMLDQVISGFILLLIIQAAYIGEILIGNTVAYIRSLSNIKTYTNGILGSLAAIYENNLYIKQLFDFLDLPIENNSNVETIMHINKINSIEFKNISFKYPNRNEYALKNISFVINNKEKVSFVGENGSGKSTLIKLILGFYDNYEGEILLNGISMKSINKDDLRNRVACVFQDFNKYELSCRENIALSKIEFMNYDEKLNDAINKACADELINDLPNGLDSQLGVWFDGGVQLSGGQWQRVALARAFLRESDCYIFDEPSSALDPVSEYELFIKATELTKNRIGIFISHRLFNLRKISSRILVLKNGELIEEGTHDELISIDTHYRYLYNLQNDISNKELKEKEGEHCEASI